MSWRLKKITSSNPRRKWQRKIIISSVLVFSYALRHFANYLKRSNLNCYYKRLWHAANRLIPEHPGPLRCRNVCGRGGSCTNLIFAFGYLCWANTLFTSCVNRGLKIISSSNKLCCCVLLNPLLPLSFFFLSLNVGILPVMFWEQNVYFSTSCPCSLPISSSLAPFSSGRLCAS